MKIYTNNNNTKKINIIFLMKMYNNKISKLIINYIIHY